VSQFIESDIDRNKHGDTTLSPQAACIPREFSGGYLAIGTRANFSENESVFFRNSSSTRWQDGVACVTRIIRTTAPTSQPYFIAGLLMPAAAPQT